MLDLKSHQIERTFGRETLAMRVREREEGRKRGKIACGIG
jgi:hypothetical protein